MKWSENLIAGALCRQLFNRKALVVVPKCGWTGDECDLLVVMPNLRIVDVEVKISRADLRADAKKDKWFENWDWKYNIPWKEWRQKRPRRDWPRRVWKHYYCMPESMWTPELTGGIQPVNPASGIIVMREHNSNYYTRIVRRAHPCRDAEKISAEDAVDIARLASLRMWDAYAELDRLREASK